MKNNYQKSIEYIYNLNKFGIKLGLNNISQLLSLLDNPHLKIRTIHVAGTNGKGSTSTVIQSILKSAGYRVGLYTSPHLVSFEERIKINEEFISQHEVYDYLEKIKPAIKKVSNTAGCQHPTFFEVVTAMAFLYFYEKMVDFAVIEVGLGGRLDATNVCRPLVSVITHIDFDHVDRLGNTLSKIAAEKGAIIKKNTPVVSALQLPEAGKVIKDIALKMDSPLYSYGKEINSIPIKSQLDGNYFDYKGVFNDLKSVFVPLAGEYQIENTSLAIATIELLKNMNVKIKNEDIINGTKDSRWPGRFEIIREKPMIILDGAHNSNGINQFIFNMKKLLPDKKIIVILGIFQDKDYSAIIKTVIPQAHQVILTMADSPRATPLPILYEIAKHYIDADKLIETKNVSDAIEKSLQIAQEDDVICITGSLYTVGDAKAYFQKIKK